MKVKITHTVDLDSVAERSKELIMPAVEDIRKALTLLGALDNLLSGDEEELNLAVQHMDLSRKRLGNADIILGEVHSMLSGINDYNLEQTQKKMMEEKLVEEEELHQQELLQQQAELAKQMANQESQPAGEGAPPPVRKKWDPVTKTTSIIEEGE